MDRIRVLLFIGFCLITIGNRSALAQIPANFPNHTPRRERSNTAHQSPVAAQEPSEKQPVTTLPLPRVTCLAGINSSSPSLQEPEEATPPDNWNRSTIEAPKPKSSFADEIQAGGRIDPALAPGPVGFTRTLLLFPGTDTVKDPDAVLPPLTTKQKYWIFWRRTFDPSLPVEALLFAAGSQATNYSPRYGQGWGAFAQRFGSYAGSLAGTNFFADAFWPSLLHQDPRYFRKGRGSFKSRLLYSVKSEFVARSDAGGLTMNSAALLGFGMSTALSNAWAPRNSITFSDTMERLAVKLGVSLTLNLVREFGSSE